MLLDAATLELMQAIGENDFFAGEQLLVVRDNLSPDRYTVIEGNRRLTAVKLLNDPSLATVKSSLANRVFEESKFNPQEIPCLIFSEKESIIKYLGFRHITGIKSWRLLEKARYLYSLWHETLKELEFLNASRELAKMIGSRKDYVERLITGFEVYKVIEDNKFFKIKGLDDTNFYFNYISDSLNRPNIREFLGVKLDSQDPAKTLNYNNLKSLSLWLSRRMTKVELDLSEIVIV
jgi:hypothetical protein